MSFMLQLYCLPRLFTGFPLRLGIIVPAIAKRNLSTTTPLFITNDLDFAGLNSILAHEIDLSNTLSNHLQPVTEAVVIVKSSM